MIRFYCQYRTRASTNLLSISFLNHRTQYGSSSPIATCAQLAQEQVYVAPNPNLDAHIGARFLQDCIISGDLASGKTLHCHILKKGGGLDLFGWNILLNLYVKFELLSDACNLFDEMPIKNTVSFVTLIQGFSELFPHVESTELFVRLHREGHELNAFVFTTILKLLVKIECGDLGRNLHSPIYKLGHHSNAFVGTALLDAYSSCGFVHMAREVFDCISYKDMVSWTGMITCYAENDCFKEAFDLFSQMCMLGYSPNNFTLASIFKACLGLEAVKVGKSLHGCAIKTCYEIDHYVSVSLLDLYTKSDDIEDAQLLFEDIPKKDVIPWSFMIARYSQSYRCEDAVRLFCRMRQGSTVPNQFTFASVLQACATMENLSFGKQIHCHAHKVGLDLIVYVSNALMDVYAKCGLIEDSIELFKESKNRNEVSWNTLIVGYVNLGYWDMALTLFSNMVKDQVMCNIRFPKIIL